jgi:hypothetical protein
MAKRAIIGFKGIAMAPIIADTIAAYTTGAGVALLYAGSMSRTPKESVSDIYYDDDLYAQLRSNVGDDVELRVAEVPLSQMETFGLGTYDATADTLEADFSIVNKYFALRAVMDTVSGLPFYFNWRVFELTGVRFDNFQTKNNSPTVCEVILSGVFKKPQLATIKPYVIMQLKEDLSNQAMCTALLSEAEPYVITYAAGGGTGEQTAGSAFAGKAITLPVCTFTYAEHTFSKWLVNGVEYDAGAAVVFVGATTVTAQWTAD